MSIGAAFKRGSTQASQRPAVRIITRLSDAVRLNEELLAQPLVAMDTEWYNYDRSLGTNINNGLAACLQFCYVDGTGVKQLIYLHNHGASSDNIFAIQPWLESASNLKINHNAPVDAHIVENHGIRPVSFCLDTMVMDWLVDENRENAHGLKECAEDHLGRPRTSYNQTFGAPKLRKDGQPYASGQLIVPTMEEMLAAIDEGNDELLERLVTYSTNDAWDTWDLFHLYETKLRTVPWVSGKSMWDFYMTNITRITVLIQRMERRGMYLDLPFMQIMAEKCDADIEHYTAEALEWAGAPMKLKGPQLVHLLYGHGVMDVKKTPASKKVLFQITGKGYPVLRRTDDKDPSSNPSTRAEHLVELRRALQKRGYSDEETFGFDAILKVNKYDKQRNTYLIGMQKRARKSRVHGRINQIGTTSGRFSSAEPNLQNVTTGDKDVYNIRDCFTAPPGHLLIVADFSQLEYRLLAHFSQEPKLIKMFLEGWDLHSLTCYNIYPHVKREVDERFGGLNTAGLKWVAEEYPDERKRAKTLNFEIIYGVGHKKLADQLGLAPEEAKRMIDGWFAGYPYVKAWMDRVLRDARTYGYGRTLWGRYRRPIMARLNSDRYQERGEEERTFVNALIQGSAADMAQKAMINIDDCQELKDLHVHCIMQVHDELIFECPRQHATRAIELIRPLMEQPFSKPLRVPMPVSIGKGPTWASAKA